MKKIVALVLCLALALSLCTVAFAKQGKVEKTTGGTTTEVFKGTVLEKDAKAPVIKNKAVTDGYLAYFVADGEYYVKADTSANYTLTYGKETFRVENVDLDDITYSYNATKVTDIENETCGSMIDATEKVTFVVYTDAKGFMHIASTVDTGKNEENVLLNGEVKTVWDTESYTKHDWELVDADDDGVADATEIVKCSECGATSKIYDYNTSPVAGTVFELLNEGEFAAANKYAAAAYTFTGSAAAGSTSDTVESAKTFDAGIALYAGMALASVAGSAVVIGKKKEF